MGYLFLLLKSSIIDLSRNKLRALLTSIGILIGILSVVLLISLGLGLQRYIEDQFKSLGANLIMIMPGNLFGGSAGLGGGLIGGAKFDEKDVTSIKKIHNVSLVSAAFVKFAPISGKEKNDTYEVIFANEDMFEMLNCEVDIGVLFTKADNEKKSKYTVLGSKAAEKIFRKKEEAIGKTIKILEMNFKIVGVLKSKGGGAFGEAGLDEHIFVPYKSAQSLNPSKKFFAVYAKTSDEGKIEETKKEIEKLLLKRYDKDDFSVLDQKELLKTFISIFQMINFLLVGIATISLIVGGIGVMNIMYVSVTERIKEIGIRRAIGARKRDILLLFLFEAVILCFVGSLVAIMISYVIIKFIQTIFPAYLSLQAVILAFLVSSGIGLFFGVFPAKKAADLSPIEAIRSE